MCSVMGRQGKKQAIVKKKQESKKVRVHPCVLYLYIHTCESMHTLCKSYKVFFITLYSKRHYLVKDNKQLLNRGIETTENSLLKLMMLD